jgi:hypothetical protein
MFFSFDEYVRFREQFRSVGKANLVNTYTVLLQRPVEQSIDVSVQITQAITQLRGQDNLKGITSNWDSMEAYWKWYVLSWYMVNVLLQSPSETPLRDVLLYLPHFMIITYFPVYLTFADFVPQR